MITDKDALRNIAANVERLLADQEPPWSQADLARASGENEMKISRLIRGQQMPGAGSLARIAEALAVPLSTLLDRPRTNQAATR